MGNTVPARGIARSGRWILICAAGIVVAGGLTAAADEPGYYSGGRFHALIRSETELAVELEDSPAAAETLSRMRGAGELEPVSWAPGSNLAILRLPDAGAAQQMRTTGSVVFKSVNRVYRTRFGGPPILGTGRIVVRVRPEVSAAERASLWTEHGVDLVEEMAGMPGAYVVQLTDGVGDECVVAKALYLDGRTQYAHPDARLPVRLRQTDPFYSSQWHLSNNGTIGDAVAGADISATEAWGRSLGLGVLIGQLDDSCEVEHDDLAANYAGISHDIVSNVQSVDAANPENIGDRHGTATMGLMVAVQENNVGVAGVAPQARFTASRGLAEAVTTSQIASAFTFARAQGVDVHNNSWGFDGVANPDVVVDAITTSFVEGRGGLGMVICFAAGNGVGMANDAPTGVQVQAGEELATLDTVIGVGSSNAADTIARYSNYGTEIDLLAPSNDFSLSSSLDLPAIVTTDNTDGEFSEPGYNIDGLDEEDEPNLADSAYTDNYGGTSASAPQVAGAAALILALEDDRRADSEDANEDPPFLGFTATMVRGILEHTADQIDADEAAYHGITSRSVRYGYGRINAGQAADRAAAGYAWPQRVANVRLDGSRFRWQIDDDQRTVEDGTAGVQTTSVLVVEAEDSFSWRPTDDQTYTVGQELEDDEGVPLTVVANLNAALFNIPSGSGIRYYGIYSVATVEYSSSSGSSTRDRTRTTYGFGVAADTAGNIVDSGTPLDLSTGGEDPTDPPGTERPRVTISGTPLSGTSPLAVSFEGNAQSSVAIAEPDGYIWDFGDGSATRTGRRVQHTYTVTAGSAQYIVTLTVTDTNGASAQRTVVVTVSAPGGGVGEVTSGSVAITVSDPDSPTSSVTSGPAPLSVLLRVDTSALTGPLDGLAVIWDLGDGNRAFSLEVAHTYQYPGTYPITVSLTTDTTVNPIGAQRSITVLPSSSPSPTPTPTATPAPNPGSVACGLGTTLASVNILLGLAALRARRR